MTKKHLIKHPDPDEELELNVLAFMETEKKRMHSQSVRAKPIDDDIEQ
jgi:hypothetical protein